MADAQRWVVVGGGPAGLLAARRLVRAGHDVTVLEAEPVTGGRVSSLSIDGLTLDAGAESFATRGGHVVELLRELGLGGEIVRPVADPAWVVTPDDAYPLPEAGWMGIPTVALSRNTRRALGWGGALRAAVEPLLPAHDVSPSSTLAEVARARLGDAAVDRLVAPVVQGIFSRPLSELTFEDIAPGLSDQVAKQGLVRTASARRAAAPAGSAVLGISGGVARLTQALAADAVAGGAAIVTEAPVMGIEREGSRWSVITEEQALAADKVVVAVPRATASALVPQIPRVDPRHVALITLVLDAPQLDAAPRGTGVLAAGGVTDAKALTHATAKWPWLAAAAGGRHVVRLSYDIDNARDASGHALADASRLLGVELEESQLHDIARVQWHDSAPARTGDLEPVPGLHLVGASAGLSGLAAIVAADARSGLGA